MQLGHVTREQGCLARAEIAYRTACAYGEPVHALTPFIAAVAQGSGAPIPFPDGGPTRLQPPGYPDLALLAALTAGTDRLAEDQALALMQTGQTIETLLAAWRITSAPLPAAIAVVPGGDAPLHAGWHDDLARLTGALPDLLTAALADGTQPLEALRTAGGLNGWALPDPALQQEFRS